MKSAGTARKRMSSPAIIAGRTPPSALPTGYARSSEKPRLRKNTPQSMPQAKPTSATSAFRSPPPRRIIMRSGQPRNASAPIITNAPSTKRVAGDEPALARNSRVATDMMNAPSTRPMISGRTYCTFAALCSPQAPAMSRRKQAMQKPMFAGLPSSVSTIAARPTAAPVITTIQLTFFIRIPLFLQKLSSHVILIIE